MTNLTRTRDDKNEERALASFVTPRISDEKWQEIETMLHTLLTQAIAARSQLDENLRVYSELYEGIIPEQKSFPWEGSANIHVPVTQELLDALHSRLAKAALGVVPLVLVKGQDIQSTDVEYKIERYYEVLANNIDLGEAINTAIFLALRDGVGILKVMWERRTRKVRMRVLKPLTDPDSGQPLIDPATGEPYRDEDVVVQEITEYDNVRVVPVELKDFYVIPAHAYGIDRQYAKGVAQRMWMFWDELYQRAKSGQYRMDKVEEIRSASVSSRMTQFGQSAGQITDTVGEQITLVNVTPQFVREYEMFEIVMDYDLDGDGYEEECLFTYNARFNKLVRAEIFPYWHQLRPYILFVPWPRPNRIYGFSIPGRLESINREINAIRNQRLDAVSIRLAPPLIISRSAAILGDAAQPWGPGARFEVNSPDDIQPMTLPDINPSAFSEEHMLRQYAERIVGLFDVNTPRGTGSRRTQAEIAASQTEAMVRFDYMMKQIQRSIVKLFEQIHLLKLQYMPERESFEATSPSGGIERFEITRQEMLANIKFVANGDLPIADKQRNRQEAFFLYQALMGNPLVASNPMHVYAVTKDLLSAWEKKNIEKLIGTEEELQQQLQMQAAAAQQAARGGVRGNVVGSPPPEESLPAGPPPVRGRTSLAGAPRRPAGPPPGPIG